MATTPVRRFLPAISIALFLTTWAPAEAGTDLRVSADKRHLETLDGKPFLWLGATEWVLNKHTDEQLLQVLDRRKAQGFTAIQVFAARSWGDLPWSHTDVRGNLPFVDGRPTQLHPEYWDRWLWIADEASKRGLQLLVMVGEPGRRDTAWPVKSLDEAYEYGRRVGDLFRKRTNVIFSIGQDSEGNVGVGVEGFRAIAEGVADGVNGENRFDHRADYSTTLMTHHPYTTTSIWFPKDSWVDVNGIQGSRNENADNNLMVYWRVSSEYTKTDPRRPALFLEGSYEDERNSGGKLPPTTSRNVRMQAWYALLAGAAGYSYGHVSNWNQYSHIGYLDSPGALQMGVLQRFLLAREWWKLVPDQTILANGEENGERRKVAVRAEDHSAVYVFYPTNEWAAIRFSALGAAAEFPAFWFDPRDGKTESIGVLTEAKASGLTPPAGWEDAVLAIERPGPFPRLVPESAKR
jgi:hypothetical protein